VPVIRRGKMILVAVDRDGTLNHNNRSKPDGPYYVLSPEQFEWIEGAKAGLIDLLCSDDILVHIVTSQNCISEGLVSKQQVDLIHAKMNDELEALCDKRVPVSVIFGVKESDRAKAEAKAEAINAALEDFEKEGFFIEKVYVVGDTEGDILAGTVLKQLLEEPRASRIADDGVTVFASVTCKTIHVELDYTSKKDMYVAAADYHVKSFREAVDIILDLDMEE